MSSLLLRFGIVIIDYESESYQLNKNLRHHGPLFHRWLPNNESDAINLSADARKAEIKVWFERRGFIEKGFVKYHPDKREVDDDLISKQGILDAGSLFGLLKIRNLLPNEARAIQQNKTGHKDYEVVGKRAANLIYKPISKFIKVLRITYGQYWLKDLQKWDSREFSLGYYFNSIIQTKWSLDGGKTWSEFLPTRIEAKENAEASTLLYPEFLTENDWNELRTIVKSDYEPSAATEILARAHKLLKQERIKQALIEGVTALEIAVGEFVRRASKENKVVNDKIQSFWNLSLPAQIAVLGVISGANPLKDLESALHAIEMRNKVVHEGWIPPSKDAKKEISMLLKVVAALLPEPRLKFPSYDTRNNEIKTDEEWDKKGPNSSRFSLQFKVAVVPDLLKDL